MTLRVVLAAGGTGGHVFPAIAVAEELIVRGHSVWLATDERGAAYNPIPDSVRVRRLSASGLGSGLKARVRAVFVMLTGLCQAWWLLGRVRPDGVVGFGGYASIPTMLAAILRRLPSLVHEQNALLGTANRFVANRVSMIATSFDRTAGLESTGRAEIVITGNPVRSAFSEVRNLEYPAPAPGDALRLLVIGGSQGTHAFSEIVPAAIGSLSENRRRFSITQQCREEDLDTVRRTYRELGVRAELGTFFDDIPRRMSEAHLVIARAGASTVAELSEAGRPAILIPYPHAANDHQSVNAASVEETGGAWVIPQGQRCAETLASRLDDFLDRPTLLTSAAMAMHRKGGRNAAHALVNRLENILGGDSA